ncbi:sensor histidine kinase [Micromonospora sp. KC606]|uniref:sensor histidine kinase n=1 Tax=Micromonospora sp. KC606 TaxID=2530379 RepID=UPI0010467591|nr:sensor histidine kinase [Micromonospora sp. KC606]TDC83295.1 sensor histidine kinase [Micromonospora sp. KC606]
MDGPRRAVPWVVAVVYGAVLAGGVYWSVIGEAGERPAHLASFVAVLTLLFGVEAFHWRRYPVTMPPGPAAALLAVRFALFVAAALLDGSGTSRALFVLVPFVAYFAFGRAVSVALAGICLALIAVVFTASTPDWYRDAEYVSDLLMFSIGLVLAICMAAVAIAERDARARLERTLDRIAELSAATERNRVARDIHDSLGHHLTAIAIQMEKASAFHDRDPALAAQALHDARASARNALTEVRRSVHALRDATPPFSLPSALTDLAHSADGGGPAVTVTVTGEPHRYGPALLAALYRAAQEGVTNARRHAQAATVTVSVAFDEAGARLTVADDGRGLPAAQAGATVEGLGLLGMRERVQQLGGQISIDSRPGAGTVITVTIPRTTAASVARWPA